MVRTRSELAQVREIQVLPSYQDETWSVFGGADLSNRCLRFLPTIREYRREVENQRGSAPRPDLFFKRSPAMNHASLPHGEPGFLE